MSESPDVAHKKRKLQDGPELEIDVSAPEPQSKKALRKAKKQKSEPTAEGSEKNEKKKLQPPKAGTEETPAKRSDYGVWIGNLAFTVTRDDLRQFFTSNCSFNDDTITRIHMPKGQEKFGKVQNKGFAYVDFSTPKALEEALGLSEQLVTGRRVLIKNAKSFEGRPEKSRDQENATIKPGHPPSRRIFVGNLGFDVTKEIMEGHFSQCGTLANVHLATFQDSGKCKGYGWVEFEDITSAETAVRGFMMVGEDEDSSDSSDTESEKPKKKLKSTKRKVWVNQLLGRRMKLEFAEDATTRYKKRFGKDGEGRKNDSESSETSGSERPRTFKPKKPEIDDSRYSKETVQRLSGAIVEGQGSKITFD
ncbi:hypothetical protein N7520_002614 [Penicillium odoratum]|uniref:uncharacterized protein n=1 Tax=Penicillium odoratum TaxID=1167516 RepID=UPI002548F93F|nr:uncharacterized protein N7520_002614 [Penicillium odoratum]KAJ5772085.1 hypothetical protein N7520_002614 [Penicillium odoratum]